jgi:hypothetical protein
MNELEFFKKKNNILDCHMFKYINIIHFVSMLC